MKVLVWIQNPIETSTANEIDFKYLVVTDFAFAAGDLMFTYSFGQTLAQVKAALKTTVTNLVVASGYSAPQSADIFFANFPGA